MSLFFSADRQIGCSFGERAPCWILHQLNTAFINHYHYYSIKPSSISTFLPATSQFSCFSRNQKLENWKIEKKKKKNAWQRTQNLKHHITQPPNHPCITFPPPFCHNWGTRNTLGIDGHPFGINYRHFYPTPVIRPILFVARAFL